MNDTKAYNIEENESVPIQNLIFDLGMVLVNFRYMAFMEDLGFPEELRLFFESKILGTKQWEKLDYGIESKESIIGEWKLAYPELTEEFDRFFADVSELVRDYPDSCERLRRYKDQGYRIYLLTNYPEDMFELHGKKQFRFLPMVDGAVVSGREHTIKPEKAIYRILLDRYHLNPAACLFLDDRQVNVDAAKELGIRAITAMPRKQGFAEFDAYLQKHGIKQ